LGRVCMVSLRIVSLLVPQGTGVCTRPAPLSYEESEGYDDCCMPQQIPVDQGGGSSSSTSTPRLFATKLPRAPLGADSISNSSTPRLSSKLPRARDNETRQTPTPLNRSASASACRIGVTPVQQSCVTPHVRVGRRSKVGLQDSNIGGVSRRRDERNSGHSRCQSLGSLGGPNRTAPLRSAAMKSPPWRGGGHSLNSKGAGIPQRAQSHTNLKSMQQQIVVSGNSARKGLEGSGPSTEKVPGRPGSCPVAPPAKESKRHSAALLQRTSAKCGPAVRRPQRREVSTGKAIVDMPLFSVDLWSEAGRNPNFTPRTLDRCGGFHRQDALVQTEECHGHASVECQQVLGEEETEAPSSIRQHSAAADSVAHRETSHGVVDALREVSTDDTWVQSFHSTSVRLSMPAEDDATERRCSAVTACTNASGSCSTHLATGLQSRLSSARPSTDSIGRCSTLVAGPAEDARLSRPSWAGAAEHQPEPLLAKDWNQEMASVATSGGPPNSRCCKQIPYPPSGSSWEWPLSRHEKQSRVVMIDRCILMADHTALSKQLQKVRALVA